MIFGQLGLLALGEVPLDLGPFAITAVELHPWYYKKVMYPRSEAFNRLVPLTVGAPFRQRDWPLPIPISRARVPIPRSEAFNRLVPLTVGAPFRQRDWPLPLLTKPVGQFWTNRAQIPMSPFSQDDWPNPFIPAYPTSNRTWIGEAISAPPAAPFAQDDWPNPILTKPLGQFWTISAQIPMSPFYQTSWPNPIPPQYPTANRTWINTYSLTLAQPFSQDDWPQAVRTKPQGQTWVLGPQITPNPFKQSEWPQSVRRPVNVQTWISSTTALLSPAQAPFNQDDWPIPRRSQGLNTSFSRTAQIRPNPFYQTDWPAAIRRKSFPRSEAYNFVAPRTIGAPFNQDDWPNPKVVQWPINARTWINTAIRSVTPRPFSMSDWPVPQRPVVARSFSFARSIIPQPIPPIPPKPTPQGPRGYVRDYWDADAWGRFVPGGGIRQV